MIETVMLLPIIIIGNIILAFIAAIAVSGDKKLGFWGTFLLSVFFSAPVGILCAFISGSKDMLFEKAVVERLDKILAELKKNSAVGVEEPK